MTEVDDAYKQFEQDVNEQVPGTVLLTKVWGSHSHGCETPESDIDFLAVYKWDRRDALSLFPPAETLNHNSPDWQAHELGKFFHLLLKGNPGIVECLFTDRWCTVSPELDPLIDMRMEFVNVRTLKQYLGYAHGQLQRLLAGAKLHTAGGEYNTKWAYHLIRLLLDGKRIAQGEPPLVHKHGEELNILMSIRHGEWTAGSIAEYARNIEENIDLMKPWPIPDHADVKKLNDLYVALR